MPHGTLWVYLLTCFAAADLNRGLRYQTIPSMASGAGSPAVLEKNGKTLMRTCVTGDRTKPIIFFIHGFPDDESVWDDAVQHYQGRYQCVCVTLPNCGGVVDRSWGFDFPEMLHMLKNTVDDVNPTGAPMVVVAHDWGTAYARAFEKAYPHLVKKLVLIDIGPDFAALPSSPMIVFRSSHPSIIGYLLQPLYTLVLACVFLAQAAIPIRSVGHFVAGVLNTILTIIWKLINMIFHPPNVKLQFVHRKSPYQYAQAYPYFYLWKHVLFGSANNAFDGEWSEPKCPVLFVYGGQGIKALMNYHSPAVLKWFKEKAPKGSQAVAFNNAGHWVMHDCQKEFHTLVDQLLAATD
ncbi:unnamed protein product [Vitrella brassicaformis CCMP3155]|uniref:AB hydrolase-1 domain-containing protein n=1 Tax=Vitrella brassicaformis (strain CCMP3155) TaxID=1169540 RepID=A0A0G4EIM1_VITBC|nr:unnamed protein product [Vitrella brassicaformis CCMP3155]|eukprot:CEL95737.1 unnamed protein product [Vitrella brassicaformis CCMP3155]